VAFSGAEKVENVCLPKIGAAFAKIREDIRFAFYLRYCIEEVVMSPLAELGREIRPGKESRGLEFDDWAW
jgi:hypothetical protein